MYNERIILRKKELYNFI